MYTKRQAYTKWLAINEHSLPPNHYRLLGVDNFEPDADIIANAADSRMGFLRQFQSGENAAMVAEILNEIALARVTLLNADKKAAYDAQLANTLALPNAGVVDAVLVAEVAKPPVRRPHAPPAMVGRYVRRTSRAPMAITVGSLAVIVGIVVFALLYGPGSPLAPHEPISAATPAEPVDTTPPAPVVATKPPEPEPAVASPRPSPRVAERPPKPNPAPEWFAPSPTSKSAPGWFTPTPKPAPVAPPPSPAPPTPVPDPEPVKPAVPDEAAQQATLKLVSEIYGSRHKEAKTSDAQKKLAEEIFKTAGRAGSQVERFVLLRVARDMAAGAGEAELAFQAIDDRQQRWQIDAAEERREAIEKAAGAAKSSSQHESVACLAADLQDDAIEADDFALATRYGEMALAAARSARNGELTKLLLARDKDLAAMSVEYERVRVSLTVLKQTPSDPAANLAAGRYYALTKGDWDQGLALLVNGSDERLKHLAQMERSEKPEAVALGDGWWDFAQHEKGRAKRNSLDRAGAWYVMALPDASGLAKAKMRQRLEEISEAVGDGAGSLMADTADAEMKRLLTKTDAAKSPATSDRKADAEEARRRDLVSKRNVQKRQEMLGRIKQRQAENEATMRSFRSRYGLRTP